MKTRILIIDDEQHWLSFVASDLEDFEVVVAHNKAIALEELENDQFELVIASSRYLDVLEIIAREYKDKRVIVSTMHPTTDEALKVYRLGARRYFTKSFGECDLVNEVKRVISKPMAAPAGC